MHISIFTVMQYNYNMHKLRLKCITFIYLCITFLLHKMKILSILFTTHWFSNSVFSQRLLQIFCNTDHYRRSFLTTAITFYSESLKRLKSQQFLQQWISLQSLIKYFWIEFELNKNYRCKPQIQQCSSEKIGHITILRYCNVE